MDVKARRAAVVELHLAGKEQYEIFHLLKQRQISRSLISRTVKRYKEINSLEDRPRSVATPRLRKAIKSRINRNPHRSMRKMAAELQISEKTVRRVVKNDLKLRSD